MRIQNVLSSDRKEGFTLFETIAVLLIFGLIAGGICVSVTKAMNDGKGRQCSSNLAIIEGAKDEFSRDHPGEVLSSVDQLKPYLRYGVPTCPAGGTYSNVLTLNQRCTCSLANPETPALHTLASP
jgi:prepilin-type N-terminal cleavage/methylation domain-containing protein